MNIFIVIISTAVLLFGSTFSGWTLRGWYEDSNLLAAKEAQQKVVEVSMSRESDIAKNVELKLSTLKASEKIIDRGVVREIQKPIYRNVCFEPDLVRLLNDAANGIGVEKDKATNITSEVSGSAATAK